MNRISTSWFNFWKDRKFIYSIIILLLLGVLAYGTTFLKIYEDITKTLPQSENFERLKKIVEHRGLNNSTYFSIGQGDEWNSEGMQNLGEEFCEDLSTTCGASLDELKFGLGEDERDLYDFLDQRVPYYLDQKDYESLASRLVTDSIKDQLNRNHARLFTPEGFLLKDFLLKDPLGITSRTLLKFRRFEDESVFSIEDNLFRMQEDNSLFISGNVKLENDQAVEREELAQHLAEVRDKWEQKGYEVHYFSGFLIAHANAQQIKSDTTLTLTVSLTAIILLLLIYYRSVVLPLFFILPAVIGLVFAVCLMAFIKPEVSAISIGAGAVVLGIIMDYSFHFFTHLKHSGSIEETIKDVTSPLLTGCLTTILAFLALTFTNSPVLQDFGLFAALSLIGAAFAVLFVLPAILPPHIISKWQDSKERKFNFKIGKWFKVATALGVIAFSVVSIIYAPEIGFDDDLMNLNHFPEDLKESEQRFKNIDSDVERNVFIISSSTDRDKAKEANYKAGVRLEDLKEKGKIRSYLSTSIFDIPSSVGAEKMDRWNLFWSEKGGHVAGLLDSMENELGYYDNTFDNFKNKIDGNYHIPDSLSSLPLVSSDMKKLVDSTNGEWTYITLFTVTLEFRDSVTSMLKKELPDSDVFDRSEMAGSLVQLVQDDFNFILLTSSALVFLTLLLIYGRIELTLITFIPMILSWLWILGIAALIGIEFNFVNIVISTFIFGLGDDFAIFITDGYISKFARNKDIIHSYKKGILLSASTTIIGTGALIFAVHPALNSVALISVIGMVAILIISFTVQPYLLKKLLIERKEKGLPPISLVNFLFSIYCFGFFLSGCLLLYPIQLIFRIIPFGQKRLKLIYHHMLRLFAWKQMYFMFNTRKRFHNKQNFDFSKPSVIVCNHQSFIDVIMMMSIHPKLIIMTNDWVYNSPFFGAQIRYLGFFPGSNGVENNLEAIRPWVEDGYSVVIFPEGTRSKDKTIGRFHKGAFYLAEKLNLDITPVLLHGFNDTMRKKDFMLLNGLMNIAVLPRISKDDESWGTVYKERGKSISRYFKAEFRKFDLENSDNKYLRHKILSNYIFKSPFIEWYVKVKWIFERKNFDFYHSLIPIKGKVYDLGCGYGYLSYFLYFRSEERELIGIDYDEDKINIAENCYSKNDRVNFYAGDIRTIDFEMADAIFINDVLHYLPGEDHEKMLDKCLAHLNPDGSLIIRDGVTDLENRHKKTEKTEKYSTQIIGFNKTENNLCFFSKEFILNYAEKNGLDCEIKEQSQKTSNILFVLKRKH
ncbi:MAG: MMPL family transporter [Flavobacteriales bacterium]|nr:MMPL family transporter [Flavobacteriales bacterium]